MCKGISVIIPFYNGNKYLKECLSSLLNSKGLIKEIIIIVDNGSELPVLENVYPIEVTVVKTSNEKFNGAGLIRSQGFSLAKHPWVMFIDPDDMIDTNGLESLLETAILDNYGFIFASMRYMNSSGKIIGSYHVNGPFQYDGYLKKKFTINTPTCLLSKKKFTEIEANTLVKRNDYKLWSSIISECDKRSIKWGGVDILVANHRLHSGSLTHNKLSSVYWYWIFLRSLNLGILYCLYLMVFYILNTTLKRIKI
jgi:glycosyltransferase involved in cell wall biosynthesis